jgi:hypothetical protein
MADVTEQQVQAKVAEFRTVLGRKRADGLDMEAVVDLDTTARRLLQMRASSGEAPFIKAELR